MVVAEPWMSQPGGVTAEVLKAQRAAERRVATRQLAAMQEVLGGGAITPANPINTRIAPFVQQIAPSPSDFVRISTPTTPDPYGGYGGPGRGPTYGQPALPKSTEQEQRDEEANAWLEDYYRKQGILPQIDEEPPPDTTPDPADQPEIPAEDPFDYDTFAFITSLLRRYGLESLIPWAEGLIQGKATRFEVEMQLFDQQAFKDRFPIIAMIDQYNTQNPNAAKPQFTADEVLRLENSYFEAFARGGLEGTFFNRDRVTDLIWNGVSPAEVTRRIVNGYARVDMASPETKAFFEDLFGPSGRQALVAYMLDPDNVEHELMRQVEIAEIGGRSIIADINIGGAGAERLAALGVTPQGAASGFNAINRRSGLFRETATEAENLTKEAEGIASQFGLDNGTAADKLEQRLRTRTAAFQGGGGAYLGTRTSGFGSA